MTLKEELMQYLTPEEIEQLGHDFDILNEEVDEEESELFSTTCRTIIN